ncbi:MAG: hypothetical protein PHI34_08400 [Acidobacteriota bacterium]|nr:hypothetical protein [Acidobacteriota bacterium]
MNIWVIGAAVSILAVGYVLIPGALLARAVRRHLRKRAAARKRREEAEESARRQAQIIEASRKAIDTSRSPAVISAHFDVIRDHAEKLSALAEHFDLPDIAPSTPSDLKIFYRDEKERILRNRVMEQVDEAMSRADGIPRRPGKITFMERALILCLEGKRTAKDEALVKAFDTKTAEIQQKIAAVMTEPKTE